jgi:NADPH-dependent glutamate synthase beta subunit-like oxidoreductase
VGEAAGPEGWLHQDDTKQDWKIAVVGAGVSGLSCAYYLALSGCSVDVYDEGTHPGDRLSQVLPGDLPPSALARDLKGILLGEIHFQGSQKLGPSLVEDVQRSHDALCLDLGPWGMARMEDAGVREVAVSQASDSGAAGAPSAMEASAGPGMYVCAGAGEGRTVVEAAAEGRRAAVAIYQYLGAKAKQR